MYFRRVILSTLLTRCQYFRARVGHVENRISIRRLRQTPNYFKNVYLFQNRLFCVSEQIRTVRISANLCWNLNS